MTAMLNPECQAGKHRNCDGSSWDADPAVDAPAPCPCKCHAPRRIQMSRQRPWRTDNPDAVVVSRPSVFGNPFKVGFRHPVRLPDASSLELIVSSRIEAVDAFRSWLGHDIELPGVPVPSYAEIELQLRGRDLACWCPPSEPCHADVLLELANRDAVAA